MRKLLLAPVLAATLLFAAPAAPSQAATTPDQLSGIGTLGDFGTPTAFLGAVGDQRGTLGAFAITYPDGTYVSGTATCLQVTGNRAYLTGRIFLSGGPRKTTNNWAPGNRLVIGVEDNGDGGADQTPDRLNFSPGVTTEAACAPIGAAHPDFFIVRGNFQVVDGA